MRFRSYLIAMLVAMVCVAGTAVPTHAGRLLRLVAERTYELEYTSASTKTTNGGCSAPNVCESSASADHSNGQAACRSDVASTESKSTTAMAWIDQEIAVPSRSTRMNAKSRWYVTGNSSASGDAVANAAFRLQIFDASGVLLKNGSSNAESGPSGVLQLNVHGLRPIGKADPPNQNGGDAWADLGPPGKAPTKVLLRAILECGASTGAAGSATVDVGGDQATRLLGLDVTFWR